MPKLVAAAAVACVLVPAHAAVAAERTVTLVIENMTYVSCPYIVMRSLVALRGVRTVTVGLNDKTAKVVYDDSRVAIPDLIVATTNTGYPSAPKR